MASIPHPLFRAVPGLGLRAGRHWERPFGSVPASSSTKRALRSAQRGLASEGSLGMLLGALRKRDARSSQSWMPARASHRARPPRPAAPVPCTGRPPRLPGPGVRTLGGRRRCLESENTARDEAPANRPTRPQPPWDLPRRRTRGQGACVNGAARTRAWRRQCARDVTCGPP